MFQVFLIEVDKVRPGQEEKHKSSNHATYLYDVRVCVCVISIDDVYHDWLTSTLSSGAFYLIISPN